MYVALFKVKGKGLCILITKHVLPTKRIELWPFCFECQVLYLNIVCIKALTCYVIIWFFIGSLKMLSISSDPCYKAESQMKLTEKLTMFILNHWKFTSVSGIWQKITSKQGVNVWMMRWGMSKQQIGIDNSLDVFIPLCNSVIQQ